MRLFLIGATGYIGGAATDALRRRGHVLSGLARSDASDQQASGARARALGWQPYRPDALADLEHGSHVGRVA